jgi:hypothetical protein
VGEAVNVMRLILQLLQQPFQNENHGNVNVDDPKPCRLHSWHARKKSTNEYDDATTTATTTTVSNNNPLQHLPTWLKRVIMLPNQDYWNDLGGTTTSTISNSESQQHAATPVTPEVEVVLENQLEQQSK